MRHVNRLARHARHVVRKPPKPRWFKPLMATLAGLGVALVFAVSIHLAVAAGFVAKARAYVMEHVLAGTAAAGLVVEEVYSEGRVRTDASEIIRILETYYGQAILKVDIEEAKHRLENLPWVRHASIKRLLPNVLHARIEEHRPFALWRHEDRVRLVSSEGETIPVNSLDRFRRLPVLSGEEAPDLAFDFIRELAGEPALASRVTGLERVGGRRWNVFLEGRIEVRLPEETPIAAWQRLARAHERSALLARAIDGIDMRHPDWLILRLVDEVTKASAGQPT